MLLRCDLDSLEYLQEKEAKLVWGLKQMQKRLTGLYTLNVPTSLLDAPIKILRRFEFALFCFPHNFCLCVANLNYLLYASCCRRRRHTITDADEAREVIRGFLRCGLARRSVHNVK